MTENTCAERCDGWPDATFGTTAGLKALALTREPTRRQVCRCLPAERVQSGNKGATVL